METGEIADSQITASSEYSPATLARINGRFAWCPMSKRLNEYVQVGQSGFTANPNYLVVCSKWTSNVFGMKITQNV